MFFFISLLRMCVHVCMLVCVRVGADLFSNCTEECKALGHSDRCWMPTFVPTDSRQGADYRSNLHVPGMDSVPDTEVFESEPQPGDKSFSTFGKETSLHHSHSHHLHSHQNHHSPHQNSHPYSQQHNLHHHHGTIDRRELDALLSNSRTPYKPAYMSEYSRDTDSPPSQSPL